MKKTVFSCAILIAAAAAVACGGPTSVAPEEVPTTDTAPTETPITETAPAPQPAAPPSAPALAPTPAPAAPAAPAGRTNDVAPAPAPAPTPTPEPVVKTVPAGTQMDVAFLDSVSSNESQVGDSFRVRVTRDVIHDGLAVVPAGSVIVGTVTEAEPLNKKIGGRAKLTLDFTTLQLTSGRTTGISATFAELGKSETKKDAATIGGAAAGGALLGRVLKKKDKDKGALIGAIVGAAAGTAVAAKTEGEEIVIPSGTEISLQLNQPAHVTLTP